MFLWNHYSEFLIPTICFSSAITRLPGCTPIIFHVTVRWMQLDRWSFVVAVRSPLIGCIYPNQKIGFVGWQLVGYSEGCRLFAVDDWYDSIAVDWMMWFDGRQLIYYNSMGHCVWIVVDRLMQSSVHDWLMQRRLMIDWCERRRMIDWFGGLIDWYSIDWLMQRRLIID